MLPDGVPRLMVGGPRRARRVALLLAGLTLALMAGGAWWFVRFAWRVRRDPGVVYRDPATLHNLLKRAGDAERAGDRATAITTYRFVASVGARAGTYHLKDAESRGNDRRALPRAAAGTGRKKAVAWTRGAAEKFLLGYAIPGGGTAARPRGAGSAQAPRSRRHTARSPALKQLNRTMPGQSSARRPGPYC